MSSTLKPSCPVTCALSVASRAHALWMVAAIAAGVLAFGLWIQEVCPHAPLGWGGVILGIAAVAVQGGPRLARLLSASDASSSGISRPTIYTSIDALPAAQWARVVPADNPYMQLPYLRALAAASPPQIAHRYALLLRSGQAVAAAYFQVIDVSPDSLGKDAARWPGPVRWFVSALRRGPELGVRLLVCGDVYQTRSGGFAHTPELGAAEAGRALAALGDEMRRAESRGGRVALVLFKDLALAAPAVAALRADGYHPLESAQPTMLLHLRPPWRTFADYLAAMRSKYRSRAKDARRRGRALQRQVLGPAELAAERHTLAPLLTAVTARADFKLATLDLDTLTSLQRHLGDGLVVTRYSLGARVVGFSAAIAHEDRLEALVVGMDYEFNHSHALYQNMLYDFVERGLAQGCRTVHFGRTALEIKSTIGAEPESLTSYLRHPVGLVNTALGWVLRQVEPKPWIQRRPFDKRGAALAAS